MSDLPETINRKTTLTFERPNILLGASPDGSEMHIRNGAKIQVERDIEESWAFESSEEAPFRVVSTNRIVFGGFPIAVLNETSEPTAADYLARVGTRILSAFRCIEDVHQTQQFKRPVYRIYRQFLTLP